jgi:hypothetical protein
MAILQVGHGNLPSLHEDRSGSSIALLNVHAEGTKLAVQLQVYAGLASRWAASTDSERTDLGQALNDSRFAGRIQATLNAYTRAAWAGAEAAPPAPQKQALSAFDALSSSDRQIVAALRGGPLSSLPLTPPQAYRSRLASEAEAAQQGQRSPGGAPSVEISISEAARKLLDGLTADPDPASPPVQPRTPQIAAAIEAYRKIAGS